MGRGRFQQVGFLIGFAPQRRRAPTLRRKSSSGLSSSPPRSEPVIAILALLEPALVIRVLAVRYYLPLS